MTYYTLQIHYGGQLKSPIVQEFHDFAFSDNDGGFSIWKAGICARLYQQGFSFESAPGHWELISPLRIHTAYLIKQDKKYSVL